MRSLPFVALLALGCNTEFPEFAPEAGGEPSASVDGGAADRALPPEDLSPPPVDLAQPVDAELPLDQAPPDEDVVPDGATPDALILADAAPPELGPEPDQAPPAPLVMLDAEAVPAQGCGPRTVTLRWRTEGVRGCRLAANDRLLLNIEGDQVVQGQHVEAGVSEDTRFELQCSGALGEAYGSYVATFDPQFPPALDLNRGQIEATQRECATALFERVMTNDGSVDNHQPSAARICRCQGYTAAQITRGKRHNCFASPHDNTIWAFGDAGWSGRRAAGHNHCVEQIRCTAPVAACDELLYPR